MALPKLRLPLCLVIGIVLWLGQAPLPALGQEGTPVTRSWETYSMMQESSPYRGLTWMPVGPLVNSGRVETLALSEDQPGTIYAGFGSGNLWKTTNHGNSWRSVFDNRQGYSIGDVALAPSDPLTLYLGTGENLKAKRGHTIPGAGVFRSNDGGESWTSLGLEDTYHIARVAVHPEDPEIVFVAAMGHFFSRNTQRGVFRSTDGGATWQKVLYLNERTGASDVIFAPGDPSILYAATWQNGGRGVVSGPHSSVYRSEDGGETWKEVDSGLADTKQRGRIGLAVSHSNPDRVYAFMDNRSRSVEEGRAELYRSDNGGARWQKTHKEGLKIFSSFGEVFTDVVVNPSDDQEVYLLGIALLRSRDAGKSFEQLRGRVHHYHPSPANYFHVDHHDMWIHPGNGNHMVVGNDGGIYVSRDRGSSWFHYNNLPVGEFYTVSTDNAVPYRIYGGTQDDAAVRGTARQLRMGVSDGWEIRSPGWEYVWIDPWSGGDGVVTEPNPDNPTTVYYESQNGHINRKDMRTGKTSFIKPALADSVDGEMVNAWLTPFFVSNYDHQTLYFGANYLFKSENRGSDWRRISGDLSASSDSLRTGGALTALAESPLQEGLIYAGTSNGALWVSRDDGNTWNEISKSLPRAYVKSITPSHHEKSKVYVALSGIQDDHYSPYLYRSDNYGGNWTSLAAGLPESPVNALVEDPRYPGVIYAGTFNGMLITTDDGDSWQVLGSDLPHSFVSDLTIQQREDDLIAATHGRGIYVLDLEPLHAYLQGEPGNARVLGVSGVRLPLRDASGSKYDHNTYNDLRVYFLLAESRHLEISILDGKGETVYRTEQSFGEGLNTFSWDLIAERREGDNPYFLDAYRFPEPGLYTVQLKGAGLEMSGRFILSRSY